MRIAVCVPSPLESALVGEAVRYGHEVVVRCGSSGELGMHVRAVAAASTSTKSFEVALVAADARYLDERIIADADQAGVRIVALIASDADRRRAADLGLHETVDEASPWSTIEEAITGLPSSATPAPRTRGEVVAVWGPPGAPGRTTVAITIAAELAALGRSVVLADVDTHGAAVAPTLGLLDESPGFAAACRLEGAGALSVAELERIGQRYESSAGGFWVLTGIARSSRWPELSAERVAGVIDRCRSWVDVTVIDAGSSLEHDEEISTDLFAPRRNAATTTAVREADRVVAVGSADPVGMSRFMRAHADLVEVAGGASISVLINRVRASAVGANPSGQVVSTLQRFGGISSPVLVPHDLAGVDGAVLSGRTLVDSSPRSPARLAIRDLVARWVPSGADRRARRH